TRSTRDWSSDVCSSDLDQIEKLRLTTVRFQNQRPVVGIDGIDSMTAAAALAGLELRVPVDWLAPLPADTFYRHELIGCRVETVEIGRASCRERGDNTVV